MIIVDCIQRSPEWHLWRKGGISASEAAVVTGRSDYKTLWRLYMEKTGKAIPEDLSNNPLVKRGILMEDYARQKAEEILGYDLLLPVCAQSSEREYIRASFDGLSECNIPAELKCPAQSTWEDVCLLREISQAYLEYYPQVQQQIYVAGSSFGYLFFLSPDNADYRLFKIERDDLFIQELCEKAEYLWNCIQTKKAPPRDPLRDVYIPETVEARDLWVSTAYNYRILHHQVEALKQQIAPLQEKLDADKALLIQQMAVNLEADAGGLKIIRYATSGSVDYARLLTEHLPQLTEQDLDKYRKPARESVRLTVTDKALPDDIVDPDIEQMYSSVIEGVVRSAYF